MDISKRLEAANRRLKAAKIKITIEQRGDRLCLRGMLSAKPNSSNTEDRQQRIPIAKANFTGLEHAEAKAKEISGLIDQRRFDWNPYLNEGQPMGDTVEKLIVDLERDYFSQRKKNPTTMATWNKEYFRILCRLPNQEPLSLKALQSLILSTEPDTRNRRRYVLACAKLADFAGLQHKLRDLIGKYSLKHVNPRDVPLDNLIVEAYQLIKSPQWQSAYGIMATYGLRNHEIFAFDLDDFPVGFINRGKSGQRYAYPLYPEWATDWKLSEFHLPECYGNTNSDLGNRVTKAFKRQAVPFAPYNLRHAWARRSLEFGWDITLAAQQMGHAVKVHSEIYHHWISQDTCQKAFERLIDKPDRPMPPEL